MKSGFKNFELVVDRQNHVFDPSFFDASYYFARAINKYYEKYGYKQLLSVGCGTGVDFAYLIDKSIEGNKSLPNLTFLDIDPFAVQNSKLNFAQICSDRAEFIVADIFPPKGNVYDFICWNIPFFDNEPPFSEKYPKARFDRNYTSLNKFVKSLPMYLSTGGHVLLMYSEFGRDKIRSMISNGGLQLIGHKPLNIQTCMGNKLASMLQFEVFIELYRL
jgi:methylase of polypeptide subunit release factors